MARTRDRSLWRVDAKLLEEAQDDATRLAVADQEEAGLDILTDGEVRRESYSNRFATALEGIDDEHPGQAPGRGNSGATMAVPRIIGPISRRGPVEVGDVRFLRSLTDRPIKITIPGPFTMSQQAVDDFYHDERAAALAYAGPVREEIADLFAAGADIVQLDEPFMEARAEKAHAFGVEVVNAALEGAAGTTVLHLCFGYAALVRDKPGAYSFLSELAGANVDQISIESAQPNLDCSVLSRLSNKSIVLGVIDLGTEEVEPPATIVARVESALKFVKPEALVLAPDCGMKFLSRSSALAKLHSMVGAAQVLRKRFGE